MTRRTTPQSKTDDTAFPVRIKIVVPPNGLGRALTDAYDWLKQNVTPGAYAYHGATTTVGSATAFYFRTPDDAARFHAANPALALADGTTARTYTAPGRS